jgi:hypothetical protein
MNAIILGALLASAPAAAPSAPVELDQRCYRLMAELAASEDPEARALGITAAHFFLGRIDAGDPGSEARSVAAPTAEERPRLLSRCSEALVAGGFDVRELGRSFEEPGSSI